MSIYLILILLFLSISASPQFIYVDENNTNSSPDGSRDNPYPTIEDAINNFTPNDTDIILLGDSVTLTEWIELPEGVTCTIRPDVIPESQYFPFNLAPRTGLNTYFSNFTLQNLQIIDIHQDQNSAFKMQGGTFTFNRTFIADILYGKEEFSYELVTGYGGEIFDTTINILDSRFENFNNVEIYARETNVIVRNSSFDNIIFNDRGFITLGDSAFFGANLTVTDTNITNVRPESKIATSEQHGFIQSRESLPMNMYFSGLFVKNVTLFNNVPLIYLSPASENVHNPTHITILNTVVEDVFEAPSPQTNEDVFEAPGPQNNEYVFEALDPENNEQTPGIGLIFDLLASTTLNLTDFTANNVQFESGSMVRWRPDQSNFKNLWSLLPAATISNVKISNSTGANFLVFDIDSGLVENVELTNFSCIYRNASFPIFYFENAGAVAARNFYGKDIYGAVFSLNETYNQTLENFTLYNISTNQSFVKKNQNIVTLIRDSRIHSTGLKPTSNMNTYVSNFNVFGFQAVNELSNQNYSRDAYMIIADNELGETIFKDCYWYNVQMGSFLSTTINILNIDNLTVDADPSLNSTTLPWHRVFQMANINKLKFSNCKFSNMRNVEMFNSFNARRSFLYDTVDVIDIVFENMTLTNNFADYESSDATYRSHFLLNFQGKPYQVTFKNSHFSYNKISNGLIFARDSSKAEVIIQNCTFDDNFAKMGGAVFAAQTMQQNQNIFTLINNTFRNNSANSSGGVFSFINTWCSVNASNNIYINNNAVANGGVGYVLSSKLTFLEQNALYQNGSAGKVGGSWYLSPSNKNDPSQPISFVNSTFKNSSAFQSGGVIYITLGDITLTRCNFQNNTAAQGSFLYADFFFGEIAEIQNCRIEDYISTSSTQTLIELNSGWLYVSDSVLKNITIPLFKLDTTTAFFKNVTITDISCTSNSSSFCILQDRTKSLDISGMTITDVVSNTDLIVLNSPEDNTTIYDLEFNGVNSTLKNMKKTLKQLSALKFYSAPQVIVENSVFENFINFSSIMVEKSPFLLITKSSFSCISGVPGGAINILGDSSMTGNYTILNSTFTGNQGYQGGAINVQGSFKTGDYTILNSTFTGNQGYQGGAINVQGDSSMTGNYTILNSTFTGNQAYQGGAINVKGSINSLILESSNFTSNTAETSGGSIYFASSSVRLVPKIAYSIFKKDQAETGGAIFVGNQPLYINSSTFESNSATEGGAIASYSESSQIVTLNQSLFENNMADYGAALRALGTINFDNATSIFKNNTAKIGGYLATNPSQLRLVIYQVDDYFLFIPNITVPYMLSHPETKIIYDSKDPDLYGTMYQSTGRYPNYIFYFTFLDQLGQSRPILQNTSIQLNISDFRGPKGSVKPILLGGNLFQFNDTTGGYLFKNFSVKGNETSIVTLSAQGLLNNTFTKQIEKLTPTYWQIRIGPCSAGEYFNETKLLCTPCLKTTYTLGDPYNTTCEACPKNMACLGGDNYFPVAGYWRISATSNHSVQCFNNESCLGGLQDSERNMSLTGFCGEGYHGIACGSCDPGYAKFGTNQKCVNCLKNAGYYIRFIFYLAIQTLVIILSTKAYLDKSDPKVEDLRSALIKAALIKIVVDFIQVLNLTSEFDFIWPSEINDFLQTITKIAPTNKDAFSVDCFIALIKGDNQDIFFIKLLLMIIQPIIFIIIATLIWMIIFKIQKKPISNNPAFRTRVIMTSIVIIYILAPGIIKSTFQLFHCANFGPVDAPAYYLIQDTNMTCWEPKHVTWTLALAIPSLIIWLIIPSAYLLYLVIRRKVTKNPKAFVKKYNVVFDTYKEKYFYWEIIILLRKVLIIVFTSFLAESYTQAYLSFITLVVAFTVQLFCRPFIYPSLNSAEKFGIFTIGFILYTALFLVQADGDDSLVPFFLAFDVLIVLIFLFNCFIEATRVLKGRVARIKQRWKKFIGIDGTSKPGFVGRTVRKLLPEKPNNGEDLIVIRSETHERRSLDKNSRPGVRHPFTIELLDPQTNRIRPIRSCSAESPEESHYNLYLRSIKSIDDNMMKIFSVRDTDTDLLKPYRADSRRGSLDFDDDNKGHTKVGSMPEIVLDIILEEAPITTLNKNMLKDERFKEIDKLEIEQDDDKLQKDELNHHTKLKKESLKDDRFKDIDKLEIHDEAAQMTTTAGLSSAVMESEEGKAGDQGENGFENKDVVRKSTMFTEEDEMIPLPGGKDEDFRNSFETNSPDIEIQKEENVKNEPTSSEESHEVMSLSAIDPDRSGDEEREEEIQENEASNIRNESSESPDIMTLSGVFGKHEIHEPHSAA